MSKGWETKKDSVVPQTQATKELINQLVRRGFFLVSSYADPSGKRTWDFQLYAYPSSDWRYMETLEKNLVCQVDEAAYKVLSSPGAKLSFSLTRKSQGRFSSGVHITKYLSLLSTRKKFGRARWQDFDEFLDLYRATYDLTQAELLERAEIDPARS